MSQCDTGLIDISVFDENDPSQHQMKLLYGCGCKFGLRGNEEHTLLEVRNITRGHFSTQHPWAGSEYYGLEGLTDKTHKLDVHNDHVRENSDYMRLPVLNDDPWSDCLAGSIKRFLQKLTAGQTRIYCKVVPLELRMDSESSYFGQYFYPNNPLGKNTVLKLFKSGAKLQGLSNPDSFSPHSLRAYFVTRLANDSGVSIQECMTASRHSSVAASAIYQERDMNSECNMFTALGCQIPEVEEK